MRAGSTGSSRTLPSQAAEVRPATAADEAPLTALDRATWSWLSSPLPPPGDGSTFFQFALAFYNSHGPVVPGSVTLWDEYQSWKQTPAGQKARRGGLIGSAETIRRSRRVGRRRLV